MDHETLDRVPPHTRAGLLAIAASRPNYGALACVPADVILQRIADGELPTQIARQLGVGLSAVSTRFQHDPRYKEARELGTEVMLDQGLDSIKAAGDDLNRVRARETWLKRVEWRAERDFPERWGGKQVITLNQGLTMDQALDGMAQKLLSKMRVVPDIAEQQVQCSMESEGEPDEESA